MSPLTSHLKPSRVAAVALVAAAVAAVPSAASAAPSLTGTFATADVPGQIATGPDGNAWFLLPGGAGSKELNRVAPDGTITGYDLPGDKTGLGITSGPDVAGGPNNRIWVAYNGGVIKVDPANAGAGTDFPIADVTANVSGIARDRDGNLWVADGNGVVKVAPTGTEIKDVQVPGASSRAITLGGDGRMWWTDFGNQKIEATDTAAPYTTTPVTGDVGFGLQGITAGPGTQVAYGRPANELGLLSPGGAPKPVTDTGGDPGFGIVFANDGAYWTTRFAKNGLGRLTPGGAYTTLISLPAGSGPRHLARGANDTLWVTLEGSKGIARISGVSAPAGGGAGGGGAKDTVKPRLAKLKVNARKRRMSVRVSEKATLRVSIARRVVRRHKVRYVKVRSLRAAVKAGTNRVRLGRALKAGRYRLSVVAVDTAGNRSKTASKRFRVHAVKRHHR